MVNEVNKLIFNTLLDEGAVYIPEIGTIRIVRTAARKMFRGRVAPYALSTSFSTSCEATSLVDAIISVAGVSTEDAEDIVRRWKKKSTADGRVVIVGVGVIQNNNFTADKEFTSVLERGNNVVALTRSTKSSSMSWVASIIVLISLIGGIGAYFLTQDNADNKVNTPITSSDLTANNTTEITDNEVITPEVTTTKEEVTTEPTAPEEVESTTQPESTSNDVASVEEVEKPDTATVAEEPTQTAEEEAVVVDWRNMSVRHYVIFGSYSVPSNANAAIRKIMRKNPAAQCKIIKLGNMHAVAVYGSYNRRECEIFKRNHRSLYRDSWIYTPKRFK